MDQVKVKVIQDWPEPRKVKDVQSFLGFTNFYHRFVFNYSDIVVLLTRLTRKEIAFQFHLPLHSYSHIGFQTAQLSSRLTPPTTLSLPFSPSSRKMTSYILSLFTPAHFPLPN